MNKDKDKDKINTITQECGATLSKQNFLIGTKKEEFQVLNQEKEILNEYKKDGFLKTVPRGFQKTYRKILSDWKERVSKECGNRHQPKISLTIPAYKEHDLIMKALDSLYNQAGIKKSEYEVILVINNPEGKDEVNNQTNQRAEEFRGKHPDFNLHIVRQSFPQTIPFMEEDRILKEKREISTDGTLVNIANVGTARKLGMDIALLRGIRYIVYADADYSYGPKYMESILKNGEKGKKTLAAIKKEIIYEKIKYKGEEKTLNKTQIENFKIAVEYNKKYRKTLRRLRYAIGGIPIKSFVKAGRISTENTIYAKIGGMKMLTSGEDKRYAVDIVEKAKEDISTDQDFKVESYERVDQPRVTTEIKTEVVNGTKSMIEIYEKYIDFPDGNFETINPNRLIIYYLVKKGGITGEEIIKKIGIGDKIVGKNKEYDFSSILEKFNKFSTENWIEKGHFALIEYIEGLEEFKKLKNVDTLNNIKINEALPKLEVFMDEIEK